MSLFSRTPLIIPRLSSHISYVPVRIRVTQQCPYTKRTQLCSPSQPNSIARQVSHRSFASKATRKAKARKKSTDDSTPSPPPARAETPITAAPQSYAPPRDAYAQMLASRKSPTLLYSNIGNPEFTSFLAALVGGYCIVYGISWVYEATLVYHPGLWKPINYMNGGVGVFMVGVGISVLRRTRGQIGSITAIPKRQASGAPGLTLEIEGRNSMSLPMFWKRPVQWKPMMRQKVVICSPPEVKLVDRIADVRNVRARGTAADAQKRKDELLAQDPSGGRFLIDPLRRTFRAFKMWMLKILVGDGFVNVRVQDKKFRMDVNSGWLLDDGQPLERLFQAR